MAYCSENQGADNATKSIVPQSASLTQNMNIMHLKTQASDSTRSTQEDPFLLVLPKMSWRGPLTSQYSRRPLGITVQELSSAVMIPHWLW